MRSHTNSDHNPRRAGIRFAFVRCLVPLLALLFSNLASAQAASSKLTLIVSSETAPAGGWVQFKVLLATPCQIMRGSLSMDFDPSVFGNIASVAVLGATGDALGYANVDGNHLEAYFLSPSGGIGQLPGVPVLVVSMPVLAGLAKGTTALVRADSAAPLWSGTIWAPWAGTTWNQYSMAVSPGTFQVGGNLSVGSVSPGGGVLPAGTRIQITGTGFDQSTAVVLDGLAPASSQSMSSQEIDVALGVSTEMTGMHLRLTNSAQEQADYFSAPPSAPSDRSSTVWPLVPFTTYQTAQWPFTSGGPLSIEAWALQNQTQSPVAATFFLLGRGPYPSEVIRTVTIPPGALYFPDLSSTLNTGLVGTVGVTTSAPIRMLACRSDLELSGLNASYVTSTLPPLVLGNLWGAGIAGDGSQPGTITWNWQTGTSVPGAQSLAWTNLFGSSGFSFSVSSAVRQWLSVTAAQDANSFTLNMTPNVSGLAPGAYTGTVTATLSPPPVLSQTPAEAFTVQVVLNVNAAPWITVHPFSGGGGFSAQPGGPAPPPQSLSVVTAYGYTGSSAYQATGSTSSGGNWLSVAPTSGVTPGTVTLGADPSGLTAGTYDGQVSIQGMANTVIVPVTLSVSTPATTSPASVSFVAEAGAAEPPNGISVTILQGSNYSVSAQTQSGGAWLSASLAAAGSVLVGVSPASLGAGTYHGMVTLASAANPTVQVPVTLTVLAPPAGVSVTPATLFLTASPGQTATGSLSVTSTGGSGIFGGGTGVALNYASASSSVTASAMSITSQWGSAVPSPVTPATIQVQASASQPGTYYGVLDITWTGGSIAAPVTLSVTAASSLPPVVADIVNTASESPGAVSPGEIITVFGIGLGASPGEFTIGASGKLPATIGGTQVLINGQAAPLLYASAAQVNAIVPYEAGTTGTATIQVVWNGIASVTWGLPLAPSAPGVFTVGSLDIGQAAALNQDNSVNSASNPAARGSVVQFFGTGEGFTSPANVTGGVTGSGNSTTLPVTVTIGGVNAMVTYHGSAPGEVSGVLQVNAVVPAGVAPGAVVPVVIQVGNQKSQSGITIAVQ